MKRVQAWRKLSGVFCLADAVDVEPLLADARGEAGEVAVGGDEAEAVEAAGMQQVHRVDDERDVGGVLAGGVGELLLGQDGVRGPGPSPSRPAGPWRSRRRCGAGSPRRSSPPRRRARRRPWARCCRRRSGRRAGAGARPSAQPHAGARRWRSRPASGPRGPGRRGWRRWCPGRSPRRSCRCRSRGRSAAPAARSSRCARARARRAARRRRKARRRAMRSPRWPTPIA